MDIDYLMRRMTEERERAAHADTEAARKAHNDLADQYQAEIARLSQEGGPQLSLVS